MHCYGPTHPYNCHCNPKHCRKIFDTALSLPSDAAGCQCEASVGTYMTKITAIHCTESLLWVPCSPTIPCFPMQVCSYHIFFTLHWNAGGEQGAPVCREPPAGRTIPCFPAHFVRLPRRLGPLLPPTYTCCIFRERKDWKNPKENKKTRLKKSISLVCFSVRVPVSLQKGRQKMM